MPTSHSVAHGLTDWTTFKNFIRNSFRSIGLTEAIIEETWSIIENTKPEEEPTTAQPPNELKRKLHGSDGDADKKLKCETDDQEVEAIEKFNWLEIIKNILTQKSQLNRKKLERKVVKKYQRFSDTADVDKARKRFNKKLEKLQDHFEITKVDSNSDNDLIKLTEA